MGDGLECLGWQEDMGWGAGRAAQRSGFAPPAQTMGICPLNCPGMDRPKGLSVGQTQGSLKDSVDSTMC